MPVHGFDRDAHWDLTRFDGAQEPVLSGLEKPDNALHIFDGETCFAGNFGFPVATPL